MKLRGEGHYVSALLHQRGRLYDVLAKRYPNVVARIRSYIEQNTCPFCRKRFATKYALYKHLSSTGCGQALHRLIELLAERVDEEELLRWIS